MLSSVSVVMITYNHEAYIAEAIEGVLKQVVNFEVELIIADDCSKDNTSIIVQSFIDNHPNGHWIKYTRHAKNRGMTPNFIWALQQAKGQYIALCEGDDYWIDKRKLMDQVHLLNKFDHITICCHKVAKYDEINNKKCVDSKYSFSSHETKEINIQNFLDPYLLETCSVVFKSRSLPKKLPTYKFKDTYLFSIILDNGHGIYINKEYSVYRLHEYGVWNSKSEMEKIKETILCAFEMQKYFNYSHESINKLAGNNVKLYCQKFLLICKDLKFKSKLIKWICFSSLNLLTKYEKKLMIIAIFQSFYQLRKQ